ncbi:CoA transferase [Achromobacter veterisilvae]|uniref:CoA transferase n=1 Tax=Achromobacter veterisilvae TaxID=2069367 RepID=A0ABZ2RVJ0_9BURK
MEKILTGTVVLDLTRFFSGPQATLFLAGLGAEVIKIDDPATGDPTAFSPPFAGPQGVSFHRKTQADMGIAYLKRARGKKSVCLNLKDPEGRAAFMRLVRSADVVVDNFSAGVADRLGIGYEALREVNPKIVHCALTGYGSTGAERHLKAYDLMVQAAVGMMSITGQPDAPPAKAGSPVSDAIAGTFAATGILAALLYRNRTGVGQSVDVSMADCLFALMFDEPFDCYDSLGLPLRQGNRIMRFSPFNAYRTLDGWIVAGAATQDDWNALLRAMDREDLAENAQINSLPWRLANNAAVDTLVSNWAGQLESAEVLRRLNDVKVPCSPVREIGEAMQWGQLKEREMMTPLWNPLARAPVEAQGPGFPIKFSASKAAYDTPAPVPGQHSREVLIDLGGLSASDVDALAKRGVISAP